MSLFTFERNIGIRDAQSKMLGQRVVGRLWGGNESTGSRRLYRRSKEHNGVGLAISLPSSPGFAGYRDQKPGNHWLLGRLCRRQRGLSAVED